MEGKPKSTLVNVWIDRSGQYGTPLDPWSRVYNTDEGILQWKLKEGHGKITTIIPFFQIVKKIL